MEVNWKPLEAAPVTLPNGLPGVPSAAPMRPPSTAPSVQHHEPQQIPQVSLSAEDQAIMDRFYQLIQAVVSVNRTPVALHKAEEARTRLACELAPRLASGRVSRSDLAQSPKFPKFFQVAVDHGYTAIVMANM
ncbi:unnamed protein product [Cylicostephanus goldi]|uniref:Uncharacterized protein n=1 Tax=Cylicostephanus goldi TaxID=71465 RepID=A0A3P7QNG0_CYLGO|nr:unnamed protein product [Cylicostephanus goldi]